MFGIGLIVEHIPIGFLAVIFTVLAFYFLITGETAMFWMFIIFALIIGIRWLIPED